ncbi:MAG: 4Fe-4S dicluster domain-containing protein [bacterium]
MEEREAPVTPLRSGLIDELREAGADAAACFQCGRCSAGCPLAEFFDFKPMQVVRMCAYGLEDALLESRTIWICASCETCTTRCPNGIDIARLMDVLRSRALVAQKTRSEPKVAAFHKAFLDSIRAHGRIHELGMIAGYKLRTRDLFSDAGLGLQMLRRGKLTLVPARIRGRDEVKQIFRTSKVKGER